MTQQAPIDHHALAHDTSRVSPRWHSLLILAICMLCLVMSDPARATAEPFGRWSKVGPDLITRRIFTPESGALLIEAADPRTEIGTYHRSDDAGSTWRPIITPRDAGRVAISPLNHDLLLTAGASGVFSSTTGGLSWEKVSDKSGNWVQLEISPANEAYVYGVITTEIEDAAGGKDVTTASVASEDGGFTWETRDSVREYIAPRTHTSCSYLVLKLIPLRFDPQDVIRIAGCNRADYAITLGRSSSGLRPGGDTRFVDSDPDLGTRAIAGAFSSNPDRWYVSLGTRQRSGPTRWKLVRSDDGGASWVTLQEAIGGGYAQTGFIQRWEVASDIAVNPLNTDDVYTLIAYANPDLMPNGGVSYTTQWLVRASHDAGTTWTDLPSLPIARELAVGIDGRYLYAGTARGLMRMPIPRR